VEERKALASTLRLGVSNRLDGKGVFVLGLAVLESRFRGESMPDGKPLRDHLPMFLAHSIEYLLDGFLRLSHPASLVVAANEVKPAPWLSTGGRPAHPQQGGHPAGQRAQWLVENEGEVKEGVTAIGETPGGRRLPTEGTTREPRGRKAF
jgi:hypothetical protein